jgi:hypothetical protein
MDNPSTIGNSIISRWDVLGLSSFYNCKRMKQQQTSDLLLGVFFAATLVLIIINL